MQIQLDHIAGGEALLRQIREEEFRDDVLPRDANRTLLLAGRMGRYYHPAPLPLRSHRHQWAVVEAAHGLACWTRLELIRRQVQTCLNERMIKGAVLFASRHESEACQVGEDGPGAILPIEPCAAVRGLISPVQPGRTRKEVLESPCLPGTERRKETQHAWKATDCVKTLMQSCCKIRTPRLKLDCLKSNRQTG